MTPIDIIAKVFPDANEHDLDYVLWNRTPFPFDASPRVLFKNADGYRRACANGIQLCELCSRPARRGKLSCAPCHAALTKGDG